MLYVKIGHVEFKNPILTASGTFGYGDEVKTLTDLSTLGGVVTKSVTLLPREGNPPPRIFETEAGMLNSIGLANVGVDVYCKEKLPFLNQLDSKIIINIAGSSLNEYIEIAKYYSTSKSKGFINGILDKVISEYKKSGKIKKVGRGLLE